MMADGWVGATHSFEGQKVNVDEIAGAARHVAEYCRELRDARAVTGAAPGEYDDMTAYGYHEAALVIRASTTPTAYLKDVGQACGDIAEHMTTLASTDPTLDDPRWWHLRDFLAARAACWGPYEFVVADNRRLEIIETPPPAVTRFDLLTALVTPAAVERLSDAASWARGRVI